MKKVIYFLLVLLTMNVSAQTQHGKIGLGLALGEPNGLCGKIWKGRTTAIDASLGWSLISEKYYGSFTFHADYLKHYFDLIDLDKGQLPVYFGLGARFFLSKSPHFGLRIPIGISYIFADVPIDIFVESAPILFSSLFLEFEGGIGFRYYF